MLLNSAGMPIPEDNDFVTPSAIVDYGMAADGMLTEMDERLDLLEKPPCIIGYVSVAIGPYAYGSPFNSIDFDTLQFANRGGDVNYYIRPPDYPGIWHVGASVNLQLAGAITSFSLRLQMEDKRGSRLENTVIEYTESTTAYAGIGPCALTCTGLFEIHTPANAYISAWARCVGAGAGNFMVAANSSRMWAHRVRGLSDV